MIGSLFVALVTSLVWLSAAHVSAGRRSPPPRRLVLALALWGVAALGVTALTPLVSRLTLPIDLAVSPDSAWGGRVLYFSLYVGLVEESALLIAAVLASTGDEWQSCAVRGCMYAGATALGFAAVENGRYADAHGMSLLLVRAVTTSLAHGLLTTPWGAALGGVCGSDRSTLEKGALIGGALVVSAVLHGLTDALLYGEQVPVAVALLTGVALVVGGLLRRA